MRTLLFRPTANIRRFHRPFIGLTGIATVDMLIVAVFDLLMLLENDIPTWQKPTIKQNFSVIWNIILSHEAGKAASDSPLLTSLDLYAAS